MTPIIDPRRESLLDDPLIIALVVVPAAILLVPFGFATLVLPAAAQTAADTHVNVTPLFTEIFNNYVTPVLGVVILGILGWLANLARTRLGISIDQAMLDQVDAFAEQQAGAILAKVVNTHEFNIDIKNPLIRTAALEAEAHIGDALDALGITGPAAATYVANLISSWLGKMTKDEPNHPTPAGAIPGTNVTIDGATIPAVPAAAPAA